MAEAFSIVGVGAVTPVGLDALQTTTAMRARINGFVEIMPQPAPHPPVIGSRVPASRRIRESRVQWLVNLAHRAAREALSNGRPGARRGLFVSVPGPERDVPVLRYSTAELVFQQLQDRLGAACHLRASRALTDGRAAVFLALAEAAKLIEKGELDECLIGGVDSLINRVDVERLRHTGRLWGKSNPQGVLPGEGAAFFLLARSGHVDHLKARVLGVGVSTESQRVTGSLFATGHGLRQAIERACTAAAIDESQIAFRVNDMNGERYAAFESMVVGARAYRTRRERLAALWPSSSVGDIGAAAGALLVVCAVMEGLRPNGLGQLVMCESSSDEGLRGAALFRMEAPHA